MKLTEIALTDRLTHLALEGSFDLWGQAQVGEALTRLAAGRAVHAVIDLSAVDLMASAGLETLLDVALRLRGAQASLVLVAPRTVVRRTIALAGLADVLPSVPTLREALARCGLAADAAA